MKKTLLSLLVLGSTHLVSAQQTSVEVLSPLSMAQGFNHSMATWGATPDMTNPANRVIAPIIIARDGSAADSLMCNPTTMDLTGKIAVLYRGSCEFGVKAKNAWDAGASAVIVVNNVPADLVNMAAGANGDVVTVPVVSITQESGAILWQGLEDGATINMLIGNKLGYYQHDLGSVPGYTANVPAQVPVELAANTTQFPILFAAQIYNYGAAAATNVRIKATINKNGAELYSNTSNVIPTFASGDSTDQFTFVDYNGNLGVGEYEIVYDILSDDTEEASSDNSFKYPFKINADKRFAYAMFDSETNFTKNSGDYGPSERSGAFKSCITFKHANANTVGVNGVFFKSYLKDDGDMTGQEVYIEVSKWSDNFAYGSPTFSGVAPISDAIYTYEENIVDSFVYLDMPNKALLEANTKYLVCATVQNPDMYVGYENETKYDYYKALSELYISPLANGDTWYAAGFQGGPVPSLTIQFFNEDELGLVNADAVEAKVYPNPATDVVNVMVNNYSGAATLTVTDLVGKEVLTQAVTVNANQAVSFDASTLTNGMYIVKLNLANGAQVKASVSIK